MSLHRLATALLILSLLAGCAEEDELARVGWTWRVSDSAGLTLTHTAHLDRNFASESDDDLSEHTRDLVSLVGVDALGFTPQVFEVLGFYDMKQADESSQGLQLRAAAGGRVELLRGEEVVGQITVAPHSEERLAVTVSVGDLGQSGLRLRFRREDRDRFWGFGEQYNFVDLDGQRVPIIVQEQGVGRSANPTGTQQGELTDSYFPLPYFLDPVKGCGFLLGHTGYSAFDLGKSDAKYWTVDVWAAREVTFELFGGPKPLDVVRQLTDKLGRPTRRPPDFAFRGVWLAGQGGSEELARRVEVALDHNIPLSAVWVQDWVGIREIFAGNYGVKYRWLWEQELYPDLAGTIRDLRQKGIHFLGYMNNFVVQGHEHWEEATRGGYLPRRQNGTLYDDLWVVVTYYGSVLDVTNPAARDWYKGFARFAARDLGMSGWMADFGEWLPWDSVQHDGRSGAEFHNLYPAEWHRLNREVLEEAHPDGNWVMFTRSGFTNSHPVAQIVWAGDQEATWDEGDGLPTVVTAGLTLGLSGIPIFTHDIAGFSGGPSGKELFLRWTELGAFSPVMRTHDGLRKLTNHRFDSDEETLSHFRRMAQAHALLLPYWRSLAVNATTLGEPMIMHTALVDPDWNGSLTAHEQWMLGRQMVFAPVVRPDQTTVRVALPQGEWEHVWSGRRYAGRRVHEVAAPLGEPAVFVRQGKLDSIAKAMRNLRR